MSDFRMLNTKDHYDVEDTSLAALPPSRAEVLGFNAAQQDALKALLIDVIGPMQQRHDKELADLRERNVADMRAAIRRSEQKTHALVAELARNADESRARFAELEQRTGHVYVEYSDLRNCMGMLLGRDSQTRAAIERRYGATWAQAIVDAVHKGKPQ